MSEQEYSGIAEPNEQQRSQTYYKKLKIGVNSEHSIRNQKFLDNYIVDSLIQDSIGVLFEDSNYLYPFYTQFYDDFNIQSYIRSNDVDELPHPVEKDQQIQVLKASLSSGIGKALQSFKKGRTQPSSNLEQKDSFIEQDAPVDLLHDQYPLNKVIQDIELQQATISNYNTQTQKQQQLNGIQQMSEQTPKQYQQTQRSTLAVDKSQSKSTQYQRCSSALQRDSQNSYFDQQDSSCIGESFYFDEASKMDGQQRQQVRSGSVLSSFFMEKRSKSTKPKIEPHNSKKISTLGFLNRLFSIRSKNKYSEKDVLNNQFLNNQNEQRAKIISPRAKQKIFKGQEGNRPQSSQSNLKQGFFEDVSLNHSQIFDQIEVERSTGCIKGLNDTQLNDFKTGIFSTDPDQVRPRSPDSQVFQRFSISKLKNDTQQCQSDDEEEYKNIMRKNKDVLELLQSLNMENVKNKVQDQDSKILEDKKAVVPNLILQQHEKIDNLLTSGRNQSLNDNNKNKQNMGLKMQVQNNEVNQNVVKQHTIKTKEKQIMQQYNTVEYSQTELDKNRISVPRQKISLRSPSLNFDQPVDLQLDANNSLDIDDSVSIFNQQHLGQDQVGQLYQLVTQSQYCSFKSPALQTEKLDDRDFQVGHASEKKAKIFEAGVIFVVIDIINKDGSPSKDTLKWQAQDLKQMLIEDMISEKKALKGVLKVIDNIMQAIRGAPLCKEDKKHMKPLYIRYWALKKLIKKRQYQNQQNALMKSNDDIRQKEIMRDKEKRLGQFDDMDAEERFNKIC